MQLPLKGLNLVVLVSCLFAQVANVVRRSLSADTFAIPTMFTTPSTTEHAVVPHDELTAGSSTTPGQEQNKPVSRAIVFFLPESQLTHFQPELRWFLQSYQTMQTYQPKNENGTMMMDTDVIIATDINEISIIKDKSGHYSSFLKQVPPCAFWNGRTSSSSLGGNCWVVPGYQRLDKRFPETFTNYEYADSLGAIDFVQDILQRYDYVLRSDMDVFLTPAFATWLPPPSTFTVGGGHYGDSFNTKRLDRIRRDMNWTRTDRAAMHQIGSTWYGETKTVLTCVERSLEAIRHLIKWEFTDNQRKSWKSNIGDWPQWYFGVVLLYSGDLAINYCTNKVQVRPDLMDYEAHADGSIWEHPHVHAWHTHEAFSKFKFKAGGYANVDVSSLDRSVVKDYCLATALEANKDYQAPAHLAGTGMVSCGQHNASSCSECPTPRDLGKTPDAARWCNGECEWVNETCVVRVY